MFFTSYEFIAFVALLLAVFYIAPKKYRWIVLALANAYFISRAGFSGFIYIGVTILSTYFAAITIKNISTKAADATGAGVQLDRQAKKAVRDGAKKKCRAVMALCLLLNFGILAYIKYAGLFMDTAAGLLGAELTFQSLALPMGISFYTFSSMGYLIDINRGKYPPERNIFKLALFVSFFPVLVQGPISRFDIVSKTLLSPKKVELKDFSFGMIRMLYGYFKKVVVADRIAVAVSALKSDPEKYGGVYVAVLALFYALQIYADFSGGIDITLGLSELLGVRLQENFERPYFAKSTGEFWQRWHITLGAWFREYLFYPISISKPLLALAKSSRKRLGDFGKRIPVYIATFIVWFTTGLWHGASWSFVVWGLLNGVIMTVSQELKPLFDRFYARHPDIERKSGWRAFQILRTFALLSLLRLLPCYGSVGTAFCQIGSLFTLAGIGGIVSGISGLGLSWAEYGAAFAGAVVIFIVSMASRSGKIRPKLWRRSEWIFYSIAALLLVAIIVFGAYGTGYDQSQFIYNRF